MIKLRAAGLSDIGRVRRNNEDRFLCDATAMYFGVADGVGGLPGGAEAAQRTLDEVTLRLRVHHGKAQPDLETIVHETNEAVQELGRTISPDMGIASTLTFAHIRGNQLYLAHVGDSRAYLWRKGRLALYTEDHNQGNLAVRNKQIREDEVEAFLRAQPHLKNAIWQAVGLSPQVFPDAFSIGLMPGDLLLLCSDGLTKHLSDPEIERMLGAPAPDLSSRVVSVIAEANRRGGTDNVSVVLVQVRDSGPVDEEPTLGG